MKVDFAPNANVTEQYFGCHLTESEHIPAVPARKLTGAIPIWSFKPTVKETVNMAVMAVCKAS